MTRRPRVPLLTGAYGDRGLSRAEGELSGFHRGGRGGPRDDNRRLPQQDELRAGPGGGTDRGAGGVDPCGPVAGNPEGGRGRTARRCASGDTDQDWRGGARTGLDPGLRPPQGAARQLHDHEIPHRSGDGRPAARNWSISASSKGPWRRPWSTDPTRTQSPPKQLRPRPAPRRTRSPRPRRGRRSTCEKRASPHPLCPGPVGPVSPPADHVEADGTTSAGGLSTPTGSRTS